MKPSCRLSIQTLLLAKLIFLAQLVSAAAPPQSKADLIASASHVATGVVIARYKRTEKKENYDYTYSILEIAVKNAVKGSDIEPKDRIFVRCWQRSWAGKGIPDPGIHGQDRIPLKRDTVEAYLKGNRKSGFDVLEPNGFLNFTKKRSPSEQNCK